MDVSSYIRFIAALVFVLALIGGLTWIARRFGLVARASLPNRGQHKRLSIVEVKGIDARRRLVLLRRDNVEHLVLLGPERDLLIETAIVPLKSQPDTGPGIITATEKESDA